MATKRFPLYATLIALLFASSAAGAPPGDPDAPPEPPVMEYINTTPGSADTIRAGADKINRNFSNIISGVLAPPKTLRPEAFGAVGDGVTDDSAAIQKTIDAASYRDVVLFTGVYALTSSSILVNSKTDLTLHGGKFLVWLPDAEFGDYAFILERCYNVRIENMNVDCEGQAIGFLMVSNCYDTVVSKCESYVSSSDTASIFAVKGERNSFIGNYIHDNYAPCRGMWIGNVNAGEEEKHTLIRGNRIILNVATAIGCVIQNGVIEGNICADNGGSGIAISGDTAAKSYGVTVANNRCTGNTFHGIQSDATAAVILEDMLISGNTCQDNDGSGIYVHSSKNWSITGNICTDNNADGVGSGRGIEIRGYSEGLNVSGNICSDTRTSPYQSDGIYLISFAADDAGTEALEGAIGNCVVANNVLRRNVDDIELALSSGNEGVITNVVISGNLCDGAGAGQRGIVIPGNSAFTNVMLIGNSSLHHTTLDIGNGSVVSQLGIKSGLNVVKGRLGYNSSLVADEVTEGIDNMRGHPDDAWPIDQPTWWSEPNTVHSQVLALTTNWNGFRYWMAYCSYPPPSKEFASVAASHDGIHWVSTMGSDNRVTQGGMTPGNENGHQADTDIQVLPDGRMRVTWTEGDGQWVYSDSWDGVNWTTQTEFLTEPKSAGFAWLVTGATTAKAWLWYYPDWGGPNPPNAGWGLRVFDVNDATWAWNPGAWVKDATECYDAVTAAKIVVWHYDVEQVGGKYYMGWNAGNNGDSGGNDYIHFAWSTDGLAWNVYSNRYRVPTTSWNPQDNVYVVGLVPTHTDPVRFDVYFTAHSSDVAEGGEPYDGWRVGLLKDYEPFPSTTPIVSAGKQSASAIDKTYGAVQITTDQNSYIGIGDATEGKYPGIYVLNGDQAAFKQALSVNNMMLYEAGGGVRRVNANNAGGGNALGELVRDNSNKYLQWGNGGSAGDVVGIRSPVILTNFVSGGSARGATILIGDGDPTTGGVQASTGSLYLRTDGTAGATLYVKEPSGWVAK